MFRLRPLVFFGLLVASCVAPATVTPSPTPPATFATATAIATATAGTALPAFAASECTNATATTRQVIERYFALSTSNNPQAVIDCFAKVERERNATGVNVNTFTDFAARWSQAGPASGLVITR